MDNNTCKDTNMDYNTDTDIPIPTILALPIPVQSTHFHANLHASRVLPAIPPDWAMSLPIPEPLQ